MQRNNILQDWLLTISLFHLSLRILHYVSKAEDFLADIIVLKMYTLITLEAHSSYLQTGLTTVNKPGLRIYFVEDEKAGYYQVLSLLA